MAERKPPKAAGMSPLARLLISKQDNGLSFREMERQALLKGFAYSNSAFEQVASDDRKRPLSTEAIKAIAAGIGEDWHLVAQLDQERHGTRPPGDEDVIDALRYQRPPGISDDAWERIKAESRSHLDYLIDKAARER